jgi:hypothetical protein
MTFKFRVLPFTMLGAIICSAFYPGISGVLSGSTFANWNLEVPAIAQSHARY